MNMQNVGEIIQFIVAPVVMITSCALILNGLLSRYAAINDRLRLMAHERLELLHAEHSDRLNEEHLAEIDHQIPDLLHRHRQTHDAVLLTYCAIFLFILTMLAIALLVTSAANWMASVVLLLFLGAMLALMIAVAHCSQGNLCFASRRALRDRARRQAGKIGSLKSSGLNLFIVTRYIQGDDAAMSPSSF